MAITWLKTEVAPANNQLAAWLYFSSDVPVSFSYKVLKRTTSSTSVDFVYTSDEVITDVSNQIKIPIIGLYANYLNEVQVQFFDEAKAPVYNQIINVSTTEQTYRESVIFHLDIEKTNPTQFTTVWGNSWLMNSFCDGYDRNGDLRCCYSAPYRNEMLKTRNGYFYIGSDEDIRWYGRRFYKIDIMGNVLVEFDLRDSDNNLYTNTHDVVWDSQGYIYMIGSDNPDRCTNTMRQDAWILKFNDQTGKMIWAKNYSKAFDGTNILNNSGTNDVHLNSLAWIPAGNTTSEAIITHSRSASVTFGVSITDGSILWTIDTGGYNKTFPAYLRGFQHRLDTAGILNKESGAHTVFVTNNSAFAEYRDAANGKFVLSIFNNNSCTDTTGAPVYRPISSDATEASSVPAPVQVLFYAVDLVANKVEQVGSPISLPSYPVPQITDFMGAVFDHGDNYTIYTNDARSFFITDVSGNIFATIYDVICNLDGFPLFPGECYRARLFAEDELSELVGRAFSAA